MTKVMKLCGTMTAETDEDSDQWMTDSDDEEVSHDSTGINHFVP